MARSNDRLMQVAFEAARFLEQSLPESVLDHLVASDPDATENQAYVYVQVDNPAVRDQLPEELTAYGCRVEVICRSTAKLEVH